MSNHENAQSLVATGSAGNTSRMVETLRTGSRNSEHRYGLYSNSKRWVCAGVLTEIKGKYPRQLISFCT